MGGVDITASTGDPRWSGGVLRFLNSLSELIACVETNGLVVFANTALGQFLGVDCAALVNQSLWSWPRLAQAQPFASAFARAAGADEDQSFESFDKTLQRWYAVALSKVDSLVWLRARDVTDEKQAIARLRILSEASKEFSQAMSSGQQPFQAIACHVAELLRDFCVIRLRSSDGTRFEAPVGKWDVDEHYRRILDQLPAVGAEQAIGREVIDGMRPMVLTDLTAESAALRLAPLSHRQVATSLGVHSIMVVPLRTQDQVLGVISVARRLTGTRAALNADDLALLEELASRAALVAHQWQALHLLETARRRLTAVSDSLPVLVCLIGEDLRYRFVNATYEKWFGISKADIVGKSMQEVLGPHAFGRLREYVEEALAGRPVTFEQRVNYQAGGDRVIRATYLPFEVQPGVYQGFVALVEDISERSRMDEALVRWEQLFQHAGWGVVMTRFESGEVVALNSAFARMHGYKVDELIGSTLLDVLTPTSRKKLETGTSPDDPEHYQFESENVRKDGSQFACFADVVVFKDREGKVTYRAANFQDITDSKKLEDDLRAAIRARDEFLSIAAHEFRTPLTALQLQLSALQRDPVLGQQEGLQRVNERVARAVRQVSRLTNLIDSLLTFSIFDEQKGLESPEDFELAPLLREVVERLDETALKVGTKIVLNVAEPINVHWERSRMDQAITNVLSNAIKYGAGRPVRIQSKLEADGGAVVIAVQDEGIGIGAQDSKRIFGRFERAVSTNHYGGFGLGLYIANKAIVDHGGTITVDSEPGAGSTFTIRLPRVASPSMA